MAERIVTETRQATAGADGTCSVRFLGPGVTYRTLEVATIQLGSTSAARPIAKLYRGQSTTATPIATEDNGGSGAFVGGAPSDHLNGTDRYVIRWENADPGSFCSATLVGTERSR